MKVRSLSSVEWVPMRRSPFSIFSLHFLQVARDDFACSRVYVVGMMIEIVIRFRSRDFVINQMKCSTIDPIDPW